MKKELKISTLSIVCVLCTVIAMPSFGASAVRSIGGAGTYSSASNAATAGSKTSSGSTNSVRAGSLRSTGAKATTSTSSMRAAATPRLSIGKYLSGVGATGKPSTGSGSLDVEQSGWNDKLDKRVGVLELDVKKLKEDFNNMTGGGYEIVVEEKDGVLTISQGDKEVWSGNVGSAEGLEELQETLDEITARVSVNETAIADLESKVDAINLDGFLTSADLSELETVVATLKTANESMDAAIKALQGGKVSTEDLNAKVEELKTVDAGLQVAINELKNSTPSTEGLVNKAYVDGIKSSLESADAALDAAIKAIEKPDVNKVYVDSAISNLNTAISNLQNADSVMDQTIAGLETLVANAATKDEIKDFITSSVVDAKIDAAVAGFATDEEIKDFVSSGKLQEEIAKLATKDSIANFVNSEQVAAAINDATKDLLTAADIAEFVKSGDMATAIADATKDLATKTELSNAKSELQDAIDRINAGQVELTNYYTKGDVDAKFATVQDLIDANAAGVAENAADIVSLESAVQSAASEAADAKLAAGTAQNMADLNAADIKELKDAGYITEGALTEYAKRTELSAVATSGSYNDLFDKPDLTQYVTETQVTQSVSTAINAYEIPNGSITADKIRNGAVTSEKINTGTGNSGEMVMLMSNGDGTSSWVSFTVDAE
jgi:exonuclease VII small subunit